MSHVNESTTLKTYKVSQLPGWFAVKLASGVTSFRCTEAFFHAIGGKE